MPVNIANIVEVGMDELATANEEHSCIMATAVLLEVFRALDVSGAYPLTVKPRILNPAFVERLKVEPFPSTDKQIADWTAEGCSMVAIGHGDPTPHNWPGHLVIVVPNAFRGKSLVIDPTITQASVPAWGIELRPLMFPAPDSFLAGDTEFKAPVNGSMVVYKAFPHDRSYESTRLWTNNQKRLAIIGKILERIVPLVHNEA
jgi:hypothetical protein